METQAFEAIIQAFSAGNRNLEILAPLNEAAWDGFHDPWETKPFFLTGEAEVFLGGGPPEAALGPDPEASAPRGESSAGGPADLAPRLAGQIASYLDVRRWDHQPGRSGGVRCTPAMDGMIGRDLTLNLAGDGRRCRRLWFHMVSSFRVPDPDRGRAKVLCNRWNQLHPEFSARLEVQPPFHDRNQPRTGTLSLGTALPIPPEATLRTLVGLLDDCLDQAAEFWRQARIGLLP